MKNLVTSVAEIAGAACVAVGAFMTSEALGFAAVGAFLLMFSRAAARA